MGDAACVGLERESGVEACLWGSDLGGFGLVLNVFGEVSLAWKVGGRGGRGKGLRKHGDCESGRGRT